MHSLQSITDFIRWGASRFNEAGLFFGHGTDNALDEAATLVLHALHLPPDLPGSWFSSRLTSDERERVIRLIQRRIDERIPLPYLLGEAWFAGMRFYVSPDVLIPRSPIAELVENGFEPWVEADSVERVLDLCCGSGCIGIAAAAYLPQVSVDLVDISEAALRVANNNIVEHGLEERVRALQSDLYSSLQGERYDVIVSNPPYVGEAELASLPKEYAHEPRLALQAAEEGLALVRRILREARDHLTAQGILVVEVGNSAETLSRRYPEIPFLWVEFARGGEGVFVFTAAELEAFSDKF